MAQPQDLDFKTREQWRGWLQKNHLGKNGVWVVLYKKNSEKNGLRYLEAVEEAVCFGWIDGKMNRLDSNTFRLRFSPRRKDSVWSKSNKELAMRLIMEGKMTKAGYNTVEEAKRSGRWQDAYSSKKVPESPSDLEEALQASPKAQSNFQAFSNSTKLIYICWIQNSKKLETRERRIKQVVKRAAENIKPT